MDDRKSESANTDARKGNVVGNYRPIAYLNLLRKLRPFKPTEPTKGTERLRQKTRGTKDQLLIDKAVVRNIRKSQGIAKI